MESTRKQLVYLMSGEPHLPYLVVSLYTLRQVHPELPVVVYAWPESFCLVRRIAQDETLNIECSERRPKWRGRNSQFLDKIDLVRSIDMVDLVLYLDADTTVHGSLSPLFSMADRFGFVATQFNNWVTNSGSPYRRIGWLRDYEGIDHSLIDVLRSQAWPSVNGGVWAARPSSPVLVTWYEWTWLAKKGTFIADECVLHLLQAKYGPFGQMATACDNGRWNSSPKYQACEDDEVVVRHYHGDSNVRPQKTQRGCDLWWPLYQECLEANVGGIRDWRKDVRNRWMNKLEKK